MTKKTTTHALILPLGKLSLDLLQRLLEPTRSGTDPQLVVNGPSIGSDVAVLDFEVAAQRAAEFYKLDKHETTTDCLLVLKADPITFPTDKPGEYAVHVNLNDVTTCGALPVALLATILLPESTTMETVESIQNELTNAAHCFRISNVGGHTEVTDAVTRPVVSLAMIGVVPTQKLISDDVAPGDEILFLGEVGCEGLGILLTEGEESFLACGVFDSDTFSRWLAVGKRISLGLIIPELNREHVIKCAHDVTEGGMRGALVELAMRLQRSLIVDSLPEPCEGLNAVVERLNIDPYRLIGSGSALLIVKQGDSTSVIEAALQRGWNAKLIGRAEDGLPSDSRFGDQDLGSDIADSLIEGLANLSLLD